MSPLWLHLEEKRCLILAVSCPNARHGRHSGDTFLLHGRDNIGGAVRQHGLPDVCRLASQSDHHARDVSVRENLSYVLKVCHGTLTIGQYVMIGNDVSAGRG